MNGSGITIEREKIIFGQQHTADSAFASLEIDLKTGTRDEADLAKLARDHGCVGGATAGCGENTDRRRHAHNVRRHCVATHEDCWNASFGKSLDRLGVQRNGA